MSHYECLTCGHFYEDCTCAEIKFKEKKRKKVKKQLKLKEEKKIDSAWLQASPKLNIDRVYLVHFRYGGAYALIQWNNMTEQWQNNEKQLININAIDFYREIDLMDNAEDFIWGLV